MVQYFGDFIRDEKYREQPLFYIVFFFKTNLYHTVLNHFITGLEAFLRKKEWGLFVVAALCQGLSVCLVRVKGGWMKNKEEKSEKKMVEMAIWLGGEWREKTGRSWGFSPWAHQNSISSNCGDYRRENVLDVYFFCGCSICFWMFTFFFFPSFVGVQYVPFLISCGCFLFLFFVFLFLFLEDIFGLISCVFLFYFIFSF